MRKKSKRKKLKEKLDKLVKEFVKKRDKNTCTMCGKKVEGSNCHGSHIIPVSHSLRLSYNPINLVVHCHRCHIYVWHKSPLEASKWFKKEFPKRYKKLMKLKEDIRPVKDWELEEWIENYG